MTLAIDRFNPAVRPSWWLRLYTRFMAWQETRAQREIDRHAHLLVRRTAAFGRQEAGDANRATAATRNAVLTGTTCEAGVRAIDTAPIDFGRL